MFSGFGNNKGFALIAVIWIAGLLAIVSTALVLQVKSNTLLARNLVFSAKAQGIADGMARLVAFRISGATQTPSNQVNGEKQFCAWGASRIGFRIQDQAGLVDLNTASPVLLRTLYMGLGLSETRAKSLVDDMQDFRDQDQEALGGGIEPTRYEGRAFGPKNAPFETLSELDQVPGIDDALFLKLQDLTTVYSQAQGLDIARAPALLKDAIAKNGAAEFASPSPAKSFAIDVVAETSDKTRFFRRMLISVLQQPDRPFATLSWEQGRSADGWTIPEKPSRTCF